MSRRHPFALLAASIGRLGCVAALSLAAGAASAQEGDASAPLTPGFCLATPADALSFAARAEALDQAAPSSWSGADRLQFVADCAQLADLRAGRRDRIERFGRVLSLPLASPQGRALRADWRATPREARVPLTVTDAVLGDARLAEALGGGVLTVATADPAEPADSDAFRFGGALAPAAGLGAGGLGAGGLGAGGLGAAAGAPAGLFSAPFSVSIAARAEPIETADAPSRAAGRSAEAATSPLERPRAALGARFDAVLLEPEGDGGTMLVMGATALSDDRALRREMALPFESVDAPRYLRAALQGALAADLMRRAAAKARAPR